MRIKLDKITNKQVRKLFLESTVCLSLTDKLIKRKQYKQSYRYEREGTELAAKAWEIIYKKYPETLKGKNVYKRFQGTVELEEIKE